MLSILRTVCDCTDWDLTPLPDRRVLVMTPSWRTAAGRWPLVVLPILLMGLLVWTFGFPPGSRRVSFQAKAQQNQSQQIKNLEKQISRLSNVQSAPMKQHRAALQEQLNRARQSQAASASQPQPTATLGTTGDSIYWTAMALLAIAALAGPGFCLLERIELDATVPGELLVRRRWQVIGSRTIRLDECAVLSVRVERLIRTHKRTTVMRDLGWRWNVMLHSRDTDEQPLLRVFPELEPTLPTRVSQMTDRVRLVVAFLEEATGLQSLEPVIVDIDSITAGVATWTTKYRIRKPTR
jgi:hypothetical protein